MNDRPDQPVLKAGDLVRMTRALRKRLRWQKVYGANGKLLDSRGGRDHVREFGRCVGIVQGPTDYNRDGEPRDPAKVGPEVDVRWQPSNLRYAYDPKDLERA